MFFSRKKHSPSNSASPDINGPASQSQATNTQQLQVSTKSQSQSHSQSPQPNQQSQVVYPWSTHTPPFGPSPSPFPRNGHTLSMVSTIAGELLLFGGYVHSSKSTSNDLYVFSTRDFSTTLLRTSGETPSPRAGHAVALTKTDLLIWGGMRRLNGEYKGSDDSLYLLNLVLRKWTRVVVNGPRPGSRCYHTMIMVGSKLFIFGGQNGRILFNDIWASSDLNCLKSNPFWELYEPAPGNEKPHPRAGHVSVTAGNHIIIFGGGGDSQHYLNDTWSFDISARKWTELQCTGSIPSPRVGHAAVLVDDVMYVFGGRTTGGIDLNDLNAFNLSTQRWIAFQDTGPGPSARWLHAMASDGTRVFVLGGVLSADAQADETKRIHVLDTKRIKYPESNPNTVNPSERTTQLTHKSSVSSPLQRQPQHSTFSLSNAQRAHGASPFQKATLKELDHPAFPQIPHEQNLLNRLPSRPTGVSGKPRHVPEADDDGEGSPDAPSEGEVARLKYERLVDLERQLSATLATQTELAQKSALLKLSEANVAEAKKRAGLELRELQAKLNELQLFRDHTLEHQSALQKAKSRAADADDQSQPAYEQIGRYETELAELRADLKGTKSELEEIRLRLTDAENGWSKSREEAEKLRALAAADPDGIDEDQVSRRIMDRVRAVEGEIASLWWGKKDLEEMECRNEG